jgi:hypothetical protein
MILIMGKDLIQHYGEYVPNNRLQAMSKSHAPEPKRMPTDAFRRAHLTNGVIVIEGEIRAAAREAQTPIPGLLGRNGEVQGIQGLLGAPTRNRVSP